MTVYELINKLAKFEGNLNVAVSSQAGCVEDEEVNIYVEEGKLKIVID